MNDLSVKERSYQITARNLFLNREFGRILDIFSDENIDLIALKGISLIQRIIDIPDRYIGDIDLLVKARDVPKTFPLLQKLGYHSDLFSFFNSRKPYSIYLNSLPFSKPTKIPYFVHLHWHLLNTTLPLFMYRIDINQIWQQARLQIYEDREILTMAPHQLIVYLSIHAFNHSFEKTSLFEDIQKVIRFYGDQLDWDLVCETAVDWCAQEPLYYSLYLTSRISKVDLPEDILNTIKPQRITRTGHKLISLISSQIPGAHNMVYPLYLNMTGGLLGKIRFIFLSLFPSPRQLCRIYGLRSGFLVPLYYLKRLFWALKGTVPFYSFIS